MAAAISSVSAPAGMAQNTVSRMIIGGSTGLRTMIAFPRTAPPTTSMARDVGWVNSSMLARVPGPADLDATEATISAYGTGTTLETACTIGTVAWAPQLIMLMFGESRWACRLTGGQTGGPRAARGRAEGRIPPPRGSRPVGAGAPG